MNGAVAAVVLVLGALLLTVAISGNYGGLFQLVGVTLPGTETATMRNLAASTVSSQPQVAMMAR